MSTRPVADAVLWPLESSYSVPSIFSLSEERLDQIVVLAGGGGLKTEDTPVEHPGREPGSTGQGGQESEIRDGRAENGGSISDLPHATAYRLWGALELASRLGPNCKLILVGSPSGDTRLMAELAQLLMPERKVVSKPHLGGTSGHPKNIELFVGERGFILVTSAMHMKRAMRCFESQGVNPVPYPVDFLSGGEYRWTDFLPSVDNLWKLNVVLREYLALGWYWMKGYS